MFVVNDAIDSGILESQPLSGLVLVAPLDLRATTFSVVAATTMYNGQHSLAFECIRIFVQQTQLSQRSNAVRHHSLDRVRHTGTLESKVARKFEICIQKNVWVIYMEIEH